MKKYRSIENNNGLNDMSADDGGSSHDETEEEGSVGSDALTAPLEKYKWLLDDYPGLRQRRRTHTRIMTWAGVVSDPLDLPLDYLDEVSQMISPPTVIAEARTDCNLNLGTARHTEPSITPSSPLHRTDIQEGNSNDEEVHGERKGLSKKQIITPSNLLLMNTPHRIDIQEGNSNDEEVHGIRKGWSQKMDFEWIFVITNIVLESMSAIFTQLSSKQKPQYALFGMILSYFALLTCIIEIIYEGRRHQKLPIWRKMRGTWYYDRPQRRKSFATLINIVALACALGQCVVTTINYRFENLIKVTVLPIILAYGVLFSKTLKYRQREAL